MFPEPSSGGDDFSLSREYRDRAQKVLARGVSSSPRASQRPVALVQEFAQGCYLTDRDGNRFIDYALGYGPLFLGHTPTGVLDAVSRELGKGLRTGGVTGGEAELAEKISKHIPSGEMTTFLSSGSEAVQLALRIARATTGRTRVIKFRSHYHGWVDSMHVSNSVGIDGASTAGQDPLASHNVVSLDWGDTQQLRDALDASIAGVIMEPAAINAGCFEPPDGFLYEARELTAANGSLLIFDEVITGFRLGLGGAQEKYGVTPDITVLGKVLGAGFPISAVTGSREAMESVSSGAVLHRGTYNGNPISVAAANACLDYLAAHASVAYPRMERQAARLAESIREAAIARSKPLVVNHVGTCLQFFVSDRPIVTLADLATLNKDQTLTMSELLVKRGVMTLPRGLMYLSTEHTDEDISETIRAFESALDELELTN